MASSPLSEMAPFGMEAREIAVLLVDDDENLVEMTSEFLDRELDASTISTETRPESALEEAINGDYDCIVSDYDMPQMDGLDLVKELQEHGIYIPFILFTGKGSEEIASEAISAGVDEYLQKGGRTNTLSWQTRSTIL
jgi:DNA-binding NtrC family response regulator